MLVFLLSRFEDGGSMMKTNFRRVVRVSVYVAAAALAINAVWLTSRSARAVRAQVLPAVSYTLVLHETVTGPSGTARSGSLQTRAVRSDGATVLRLGSAEDGSRLIWLPSGIQIMTDDRSHAKSTMRRLENPNGWYRNRQTGCIATDASHESVLGEETVDRYRAVKISRKTNARIQTVWYALDYGCAVVRSRMDFGGLESSEWRVVTLVPGEPADELFAIPSDYKEGPLSALDPDPPASACGPDCQEQLKRRKQRMDAEYYKYRIP